MNFVSKRAVSWVPLVVLAGEDIASYALYMHVVARVILSESKTRGFSRLESTSG